MLNSLIDQQSLLAGFLKTTREANKFLYHLDNMSNSVYLSGKNTLDSYMATKVDAKTASFLQGLFVTFGINLSISAEVKNFLDELKTTIKKIHQIKLILAIDPTESFVEVVYNWTVQNIGNGILVNVETNKDILAGIIIIYKGLYKDYSLAPQISNYFIENREDVQKLLA
jgi:hypothetical protein